MIDVRHEKLLESDITERLVQGFAEAGIGRPCIHYCKAPASGA